jgi:signal transduction histidine kinase/ActR/RegA family two-component response regulator
VAVVAATLVVLAGVLVFAKHVDDQVEWRVGYHDMAPFLFPRADGSGPQGFARDVFEIAAKRINLKIRWVHVPEGAAAAFRDGKIDLWTRSSTVPGFTRAPFVTTAWFYDSWGLVVPAGSEIWGAAELKGRIVTTGPTPFQRAFGQRLLPESDTQSRTTVKLAIQSVCSGEAAAAFADQRQALSLILDESNCAKRKLTIRPLRDGFLHSGIGSTFRAILTSVRLRRVIDQMGESGELANLHARWYLVAPNEMQAFDEAASQNRKNIVLLSLVVALFSLSTVLAWAVVRLKHARMAADRANLAKSAFLASMSHEIRTPMNGVIGMTEVLSTSKLTADQRDMVDTIHGSTQALLSIINDILDFSKIEAGIIGISSRAFNIRDLISQSVAVVDVAARNKHLSLTTEIAPDVPEVLIGDPGRIRQVLVNFLGNALKFTPFGGVQVLVSLVFPPGIGKEPRLRIEVIDTGRGIAPEKVSTLFRPFTQVDSGDDRAFGGTGLGLAISKRLVAAMKGDIGVSTEVGSGSRFWFEIPAQEGSLSQCADRLPELLEVHSPSLRILVAEDNVVNQKVIVRLLETLGHSVEVATDGALAIARFEKEPWDVVLMDCQMPIMDGFEAARRMRAAEASSKADRTPIIALTAGVLDEDRARCREAGMDEFVSKPVQLEVLSQVLAHASTRSKHPRSQNSLSLPR